MGGFGVGGGDEPPRNPGLAGDVGMSSPHVAGPDFKDPSIFRIWSREPPAPFLTSSSGKPGWLEAEIFHSLELHFAGALGHLCSPDSREILICKKNPLHMEMFIQRLVLRLFWE